MLTRVLEPRAARHRQMQLELLDLELLSVQWSVSNAALAAALDTPFDKQSRAAASRSPCTLCMYSPSAYRLAAGLMPSRCGSLYRGSC